jgi:hypothetical protein
MRKWLREDVGNLHPTRDPDWHNLKSFRSLSDRVKMDFEVLDLLLFNRIVAGKEVASTVSEDGSRRHMWFRKFSKKRTEP